MTKRMIVTGAVAAFLVSGLAVVEAQGRRGPAGPSQLQQGQLMGPRGGRMLGVPGRGFDGRRGGGRRRGGPLAGLAAVGLSDDQRAQMKTILDAARAEELAAREKTHAAILALLTPEQKAKLGKSGPPR